MRMKVNKLSKLNLLRKIPDMTFQQIKKLRSGLKLMKMKNGLVKIVSKQCNRVETKEEDDSVELQNEINANKINHSEGARVLTLLYIDQFGYTWWWIFF